MSIDVLAKRGNLKIVVYLTDGVCDKIVGAERHSGPTGKIGEIS